MQKIIKSKLKISNDAKEYILGFLILVTFVTYYFDLLKDGMMTSGLIAIVVLSYIALIWSEKVHDERDEYIRLKVDRYLYIITMSLFLGVIIYKTSIHHSYMTEIVILTVLALSKIILTKVVKSNN
jgi:hypothetical protein